ncbi:cache domain-containing sensor histidine kinase [Sediminibacillus massiliensis]|uniref:cache domain-containing sensor histidine kinase n=1 Tax=Sediminibacillus massiliensis TaxID=1926277 RepID=UPI0009883DE4|nr:histidine kinase [Sediminibacillus massiliensis]
MFRRWNLKKQFATVFLVLITLPTILFGILIYYQTTHAFKKQAEENTIARLEKNDDNLISIIRNIETMTSYMIYDESFKTFMTTPETEVQEMRRVEENIKGYLTFQLMSNRYIDSILLSGEEGSSLEFGTPIQADESSLLEQARTMGGGPSWSDSYQVESEWGGTQKVVSLSRMINDIDNISEPIGLVRIRLDVPALYQAVETDAEQQGDYFVLSESGEVVLHPDTSMVGDRFPDNNVIDLVMGSEQNVTTFQHGNDDYLLVKSPIEGTSWYSVVTVNEGEVVKGLYQVRSLITDMILLLILLGIIAFAGFYYFNIKRITELTAQTKQLENGDFSAKVNVTSEDEIGRLGARFNRMVVMIQQYIDREYKLKIKQKESELKALQSQIDPHFLYNTLDMIRWTARLEKAMETGQLIERLSKIFRMNLNMGKMWVTVEEEVIYIQNYLELQKSRMGERLQFSIYYDAEIKDAYIMKQLLQPLVENSILHGFKDLQGQGFINLRCYRKDEDLIVDIIDNGRGFPDPSDELKQDSSKGYALENLRERLGLAFGSSYSIEKVDRRQGAWIQVKMPVLHKDDIKYIQESGEQNDL